MKRILLIAVIALLGMASAQAQEQEYGIELKNDTIFRSNGKAVVNYVRTYPPRFLRNDIVFYFDIESWNITDSLLVNTDNQVETVLRESELDYELFNIPVRTWLEGLTSPTPVYPDTLVIEYIGQLVYDYKVLGGN